MKTKDKILWPYKPKTSLVISILLLIGLLSLFIGLKKTGVWPTIEKTEVTIVVGLLIFSFLPVILALVDTIIERGGKFKFGQFEFDFSKVQAISPSAFSVPSNVGLPDIAVDSSAAPDILKIFKRITSFDIAIIDLEDGTRWWETRLLVLLAGSVRHKRPEKIVFIGKDAGIDHSFLGWGYASKLLPYLLKADTKYLRSYYATHATSKKFELIEPFHPDPPIQNAIPANEQGMLTGLAGMYQYNAFDDDGLPDELIAEKMLAWELGKNVEQKNEPRKITVTRLEELFRTVLHKECIDETWTSEHKKDIFFSSDSDFLAITKNKQYISLISRLAILSSIMEELIGKE